MKSAISSPPTFSGDEVIFAPLGVLVLGSKETLRFMAHEEAYQQIAPPEKIFRKVK